MLWIGFLCSYPQGVNAGILSEPASDLASKRQSCDNSEIVCSKTSQTDARQSSRKNDRAASGILSTLNIAPAEFILPQMTSRHLHVAAADLNLTVDRIGTPQAMRGVALQELFGLEEQQDQQVTTIAQALTETDTAQETLSQPIDPELGRIRLHERSLAEEQSIDPELGKIRLRERSLAEEQSTDSELGRLRLRESPIARPRPRSAQSVFLSGRIDYFRSSNILLDDVDPVDDQLITIGASLLAVPSIGPRTQLVASVGGNLARYGEQSDLNYSDIQLRLGIRQNLFSRTYGELSWTNQQFFANDGDRFLNDHSIRLSLWRRDPLAPRLNLDSFYQFRLSFADPNDRSRFSNTIGAYLNYELQRNLEVGLDYQLVLTHFTQQEREDSYHQITAQLSYDLSRNSRISLYGGFSFGESSEPSIDFNSALLGISLSTSLSIF